EGLNVVAGGRVEHAVGAEVDRAAVVVGGAAERVPVEDRRLGGEQRLLRVGVVDCETAKLVVLPSSPGGGAGGGVGVVQVGEVVGSEGGVEGDAQEAALAGRIDIQVQGGEGAAVGVDELHVAALLQHEEPTVGGELHRGRACQAGGDGRVGEP